MYLRRAPDLDALSRIMGFCDGLALKIILPFIAVMIASPAFAHDPIISCFDNKDGTITCEAGYSDGAASAGQTIRVMMPNKRLILENKFGRDSSYTFKKPEGDFLVEFVGDPGHRAVFDSAELED